MDLSIEGGWSQDRCKEGNGITMLWEPRKRASNERPTFQGGSKTRAVKSIESD